MVVVSQKLFLEDCLDDTPQTRAMVDVFERDAAMLKKFSKAFSSSCQKVMNAQVAMISATQEMSYYLRLYGMQNFPLDPSISPSNSNQDLKSQPSEPETLASKLNLFANYVDEISTCFQVFVTQLNDAMIYPLNKLIDSDFDELNSLSKMYQLSSEEEEAVRQKYLRIPNRKEYDQQRVQAGEECYAFKKKFHHTAMNYFSSLNTLQYKRQYMFLEPMMSFIHSLKLFFKMGNETFSCDSSSKIDEFLNNTSSQVCEIKAQQSENMNKTNQLIDLIQQDDSLYYVEQSDSTKNSEPISKTILQKSGYLNLRSRFPFISRWDRSFYFIQNGFLMHQQKTDIAGSAFLELKSDLTVTPCEIDERLFTFQINSQFPKKVVYFQANSNRDRDEWITILENAIKDDNRAKLQSHMSHLKLNNNNPSLMSFFSGRPKGPNIRFELDELLNKSQNELNDKEDQGESFKVRFLGSMNVKSDKGNENINETIRQVMSARAEHNIFKLSEFDLIVNSKSVSLFKVPDSNDENGTSQLNNIDDLYCAKFKLDNIGFWSAHNENEHLFGFIVKDRNQTLKFSCHVFESDVGSKNICDAISKATQQAFKELVDSNRSEHLKLIKQREKEILLANINSLPDKIENGSVENSDIDDDRNELINAAQLAFSSPNPSFVVLDRELLENLSEQDNLTKQNDESVPTENQAHDEEKRSESEA
ncbi:unnamed protein product [Brachionus calyciflorus]|uniref:Uncharacterized protein n=1 Tax=Brachionus calyciflorus TaxID=104777 RepID=A0A814FBC8_9BILA|nr:unnamed protein product [Brachionus calyciflorus]